MPDVVCHFCSFLELKGHLLFVCIFKTPLNAIILIESFEFRLSQAFESGSLSRQVSNTSQGVFSLSFSPTNLTSSWLIPGYENCITSSIPLTKGHFLEAYSKGKWNLSNVPCPQFISKLGLMVPPDAYDESSRSKRASDYLKRPHWRSRALEIKRIAHKAMHSARLSGMSVSIVDESRQHVMASHSLPFRECPRKVSIDGHALLSSQYFILLDASKDWRFENNPLVKNFPKIRLYVGVPLTTKDGHVVGIFSVFDGFPRAKFDADHLHEIQVASQDIMKVLDGPEKPVDEDVVEKEEYTIFKQLGRATASANGSARIPLPVYEKDGSGNAYNQNFNFRFGKHEQTDQSLVSKALWEKIIALGDFRAGASALSQSISERCGCDFVYVVEIRVAEEFAIASEFFPKGHEIEAELFKYAERLHRVSKEHITSRVVGGFPAPETRLLEHTMTDAVQTLHYRALSSEFGIFVRSQMRNVRYSNGVCMAFYRTPSKLVRKKKARRQAKDEKMVDLYLKSGGYILGAFFEREKEVSHEDINFMLTAAATYRKACLQK